MENSELSPNKEGVVYKPSNPWTARVLENYRITPPESPDDIRHIVLSIENSGIAVTEGQSVGVIVPGVDEEGKKHRVRLYSVASPREGEPDPARLALTVKRVIYKDEVSGELKKGVASNYLCDRNPGEELVITGPVGRTFFLPDDPASDIIMIAVGTGIAPFRAFIHHMYRNSHSWKGQVLLFFGAKTGLESLYMNDQNNDIGQYYTQETFKAFTALSQGSNRRYVQHHLRENMELIWDIMKRDHFHLYICGIKGMEESVTEVFQGIATGAGLNWEETLARYQSEKRWHIEVY